MGSMNISIKKEAYDLLMKLKGKDKSFSEVIIEIISDNRKKSRDISKFGGVLRERSESYWNDRDKKIKDIRKDFDSEIQARGKR